MKIVSLIAENVKRLTAVEIRPDGSLVQITGRNGAGKTSVLDAIWWAISGAKHLQSQPIRAGAAKAVIRLDLGEIVVTRRFTRQEDETFTTSIIVENADGARFQSPQALLDGLVGSLTFDPLHFMRMEPKEQVKTLRGLVPGIDFDTIDTANKADYAKRTEHNRTAGDLKARARTIDVPADTPEEPIDETALVTKLETAAQHNGQVERERARRESMRSNIAFAESAAAKAQEEIEKHRAAIARLEAEVADKLEAVAGMRAELDALPPVADPVDTADVRRQIDAARANNRNVLAGTEKRRLERQALENEVAAGKLTKAMDDRNSQVAAAVAAAQLPVKGLAFGDGMVLLNGLPFEQASDAEQLRTSMAIAMAMSPKLQVIRVRDGSLLDDDGLRIVEEMAEARGFQVWIERVETSGKVGFVIEDGALKGAPLQQAAE